MFDRTITWLVRFKDWLFEPYYRSRCEKLMPKINEKLRQQYGDQLPKLMHLSCGWGGDELTPEWKCPKCGEQFPDP